MDLYEIMDEIERFNVFQLRRSYEETDKPEYWKGRVDAIHELLDKLRPSL